MALSKSTLDGNVETLLLAVLAEGPSYGYQIVRDLNDRAAGLLSMGEGTVYPVLHRLEDKQLIAGKWEHDGRRGRPRKYYRLTPKGRQQLRSGLSQWAGLVEVIQRFGGEAVGTAKPPRTN
jgi:PadR family transcriptional regulator PadR